MVRRSCQNPPRQRSTGARLSSVQTSHQAPGREKNKQFRTPFLSIRHLMDRRVEDSQKTVVGVHFLLILIADSNSTKPNLNATRESLVTFVSHLSLHTAFHVESVFTLLATRRFQILVLDLKCWGLDPTVLVIQKVVFSEYKSWSCQLAGSSNSGVWNIWA